MAPTTYKWSYNLYKWRTIYGFHWVFLTPRIGVISPHWFSEAHLVVSFRNLVASIILSHTPNCAQCMDNSPTWNVKHGHTKGNWLGKSSHPIRSIRNPPFPRPILDRPPWPFVYFAGDLLQMLLFVLTGSQLIIVRHLWRFTQWSNGPPKNVHVFFFFWGGGVSTLLKSMNIYIIQIHMVGNMFTWSPQLRENIWTWD